ncbi:transmembrane protein 19-like [Mercenaria mercenaria]|uniref:transmembrane protein 19-like n=1 Tax=Mercenaria mercenaria TaxID=6596 RepID=UPI001E1D5D4B|nr:transmembrane protein 19-like [Mercenaria mercenaria]
MGYCFREDNSKCCGEVEMKPVIILAGIIPLSLVFWLSACILHHYKSDVEPVSPVRFLIAVVAPVLITRWGLQRGSLDKSGAIAALLVGFLMTISNLCFFSALLTFFVAGSKVTKFRTSEKRKLEDDFREGGMRNWVQVLCNGGIAAEMAVLYLIDVGCSEKLIDFTSHYNASWFSMAVLGALCCSCGDTFSSEIGSVVGRSREAILITNFNYVPKGTNGAISMVGVAVSFVGGALVGLSYYLTLLLVVNEDYLLESPAQWPLIPICGLLGFLGSTVDSVLGATLQYSGYDRKKQCVVHHPGSGVDDISGTDFLDNHSVNLLASLLTSITAPKIAFSLWNVFLGK